VEGEGDGVAPQGSGAWFTGFEAVPADDVKVKLADGSLVAARHAGSTAGLLAGAYWFEVPADTTTATLLVGPHLRARPAP
jgi:hypothetical protein